MTPPVLVLAGMDLKVRRSATVVVGRSFWFVYWRKALYQISILIYYFRICVDVGDLPIFEKFEEKFWVVALDIICEGCCPRYEMNCEGWCLVRVGALV